MPLTSEIEINKFVDDAENALKKSNNLELKPEYQKALALYGKTDNIKSVLIKKNRQI